MKIRRTYIIALFLNILGIFLSFIEKYIIKYQCSGLINTIHYKSCILLKSHNSSFGDFTSFLIFLGIIFIILSIAKFGSDLFDIFLIKLRKK